jgi:glutamate/tyrosine decarboxylase-like PLP-dependent enzyme
MRNRIRLLERRARKLDPGPDERRAMHDAAWNYTESFLGRLPGSRTYVADRGRHGLGGEGFSDDPTPIEELLQVFEREVDTTGILPASGGQMGYIPGGGLYPSAVGDFLAAVSNRYSGVVFASPGAAEMEGALIRWMCTLAGYPESSAGDLTSGGSLATLSALVAARDAHGIDHEAVPRSCVYLTEDAHHCVGTALHVAGLGAVPKRRVPMDARFRMDVAALRSLIKSDQAAGLHPWLVIGSAGTTDTGAIDPIDDIADSCSESGTWFHLDAAYGGFFLLCPEGRERLAGMHRADSIVMDPHKGLGLPYGSGAVLVRQGRQLSRSFRYYADYMQDAMDAEQNPDAPYSPADHSPELTRHFRGPRMWFPLKTFGLAPFRASLAEKIWLARYFHREIAKLDGFEAGPAPELSIVTFRFVPDSGDADAANRRLLRSVHEDGKVFITSTRVDGKFTLRLAVLNFRTHLEQVDYLLGLLERASKNL